MPGLVEAHQDVEVAVRHRPPPRAAREGREDLPRARIFVGRAGGLGRAGGPAGEDALPARRLPGAGGVEGPGDADPVDGRLGRLRRRAPALGDGEHLAGRPRLQHAVALRPPLHERDAEHPRPRPRRDADLEVVVGVQRVLLPRAVAEHRPRERARRRGAGGAADGERGHALAVQPHLEPLPVLQAAHVVVELPPQPYPDVVLAVEGEVVPDGDAPARPERQVLAHAAVLEPHRGQDVGLGGRLDAGVAHREPADAPGREDVAVEQGRRHREDVGHVVEAEVRVVGGQQGGGVDIERQQVAHRVGVLPPVEAVDGGAPGLGVGGGDAVEGRLQRRGDGGVGVRLGPRPARRRHRPRAQLPHHLLPRGGMVAHAGGVHRVEGEPGRQEALVVAGDAVAVEDGANRLGLGLYGGAQRWRGVPEQDRAGHGDDEPDDASASSRHGARPQFSEATLGRSPKYRSLLSPPSYRKPPGARPTTPSQAHAHPVDSGELHVDQLALSNRARRSKRWPGPGWPKPKPCVSC